MIIIGWGPGQYAPIHDHPKEGSLMNIIKGPGLRETTFWKPPESEDEDYNLSNEEALHDKTQFYTCHSFLQEHVFSGDNDGCEFKNQTTSYITKKKSLDLTRGKIRFHKGFNHLHALKNVDENETTFTLHHILGNNKISWWLNNQDESKMFE